MITTGSTALPGSGGLVIVDWGINLEGEGGKVAVAIGNEIFPKDSAFNNFQHKLENKMKMFGIEIPVLWDKITLLIRPPVGDPNEGVEGIVFGEENRQSGAWYKPGHKEAVDIPIGEWGALFKEAMPKEIRDLIEKTLMGDDDVTESSNYQREKARQISPYMDVIQKMLNLTCVTNPKGNCDVDPIGNGTKPGKGAVEDPPPGKGKRRRKRPTPGEEDPESTKRRLGTPNGSKKGREEKRPLCKPDFKLDKGNRYTPRETQLCYYDFIGDEASRPFGIGWINPNHWFVINEWEKIQAKFGRGDTVLYKLFEEQLCIQALCSFLKLLPTLHKFGVAINSEEYREWVAEKNMAAIIMQFDFDRAVRVIARAPELNILAAA